MDTDPDTYRIEATGQRVNALELDLHLFFGVWSAVDRTDDVWTVRTEDGAELTLVPVDG
ncbi:MULTISPECIES: hypothetical protein [Haloarcula]|uniref:Uncharacterized protein n=1 Tax=Haloarcula pellucida TaxID=1427151 RepID=A0A830GNJ0_9EURY|nr:MULTISPECIES: hypothetical protein [Halomicroarcula]MBX0348039.1 hypothetical protein [Halomicroarcula pellucida]MDS0277884.1 hypothetical protein [Halomicroarcula sp. S1AR25-4]QIO23529.1 hypothetical protein G9465_14700 [Haloarcula sp. JP-L23]GGN96617.1 hypothetical protein GCM10009030_25120 [Halomicroarcula pellucida]